MGVISQIGSKLIISSISPACYLDRYDKIRLPNPNELRPEKNICVFPVTWVSKIGTVGRNIFFF